MEGGDGGEGGEGGGGGGGGGGSGVSISGGADRAHSARRRKAARAKLPNKPLDWQVSTYVCTLYMCNFDCLAN